MLKDIAWRAMTAFDLPEVQAIADEVHLDFFEAPEVLAERLSLYQNGCYILEVGEKPVGYVLSHPWTYGTLPPLNTLLHHLPPEPDTYYVHDLCLMPLVRRVGASARIVEALTKHARAEGYPTMTLAAVNGSIPFWQRQGFEVVVVDELYGKLLSYEDAASYMVKKLA